MKISIRLLYAVAALTSSAAGCTEEAIHQRVAEPPNTVRRLAPPALLQCDRNELTSYTGTVTEYKRSEASTFVIIHTDADTIEKVTVVHEPAGDPGASYLANNKPFTEDDWGRIEASEGVLYPGMRVTAWVCLDGETPPILDWHPTS